MLKTLIARAQDADVKDIERAACELKLNMLNELNHELAAIKPIFNGDAERRTAFIQGTIKASLDEVIMAILIFENDLNNEDIEVYYQDLEKHYEETQLMSLTTKIRDAIRKVIHEDTEIPKPDKYWGMG
jgi:hypothetical protein